MSGFQIKYCITLPPENTSEYSEIQGFPHGLLKRNKIIRAVLRDLPPTILELFHPSVRTLQQRLAGQASYAVFPLLATELSADSASLYDPFWVIFVDSETRSFVKEWVDRSLIPVLVVDVEEASKSPQ